eukprot:641261-Pyramimonas_sp.AAC.1
MPHDQIPLKKIRFMGNARFTALFGQACEHQPGAHDAAPEMLPHAALKEFSGNSECTFADPHCLSGFRWRSKHPAVATAAPTRAH